MIWRLDATFYLSNPNPVSAIPSPFPLMSRDSRQTNQHNSTSSQQARPACWESTGLHLKKAYLTQYCDILLHYLPLPSPELLLPLLLGIRPASAAFPSLGSAHRIDQNSLVPARRTRSLGEALDHLSAHAINHEDGRDNNPGTAEVQLAWVAEVKQVALLGDDPQDDERVEVVLADVVPTRAVLQDP